eukprot:gene3226-8242_t
MFEQNVSPPECPGSSCDHIAALVLHSRVRSLSRNPSTYYVPESSIAHFNKLQEEFAILDKDGPVDTPPLAVFRPLAAGQIIQLEKGYFVRVLPVAHRLQQSFCFVLQTKERQPLPEEFRQLKPHEIKALYEDGILERFGPPKSLLVYSDTDPHSFYDATVEPF